MIRKHLLSAIGAIATFAVVGLHAQSWTQIGSTAGQYINKISTSAGDPNLVIATSAEDSLNLEIYSPFSSLIPGHGIIISRNGGESFDERRLDSLAVFDAIKSRHHSSRWYATARYLEQGGVVISEDNGVTWDVANMHGVTYSSQKYALAESPFNPDYVAVTALATDEGYNYTTDNFKTCTANADFDIQARCISFSEAQAGLVYVGGDDSFADGVYRSLDSGKTWTKYNSGLENLRVLSVWASNELPQFVYCGVDTVYDFANKLYMGRGIYVSQDTGKTWMPIGATGSRVFDIKQHPKYPRFLVAAGNSEGVYVSSAYGFYWEIQSDGLPKGVEVRSIAIPNNEPDANGGFSCFAGTQGAGIYKSTPLYTGIEEKRTKDVELMLYPMPCSNYLNVAWENPNAGNCKIEVRDLMGNEVATILNAYCPEGHNSLTIDRLDNFVSVSGTYFISIIMQNGAVSKSFIKL